MNSADRLPDDELFHVPHFRTWRRVIGLEQREVAALSGMFQSNIAHIEAAPSRWVHGFMVNRLAAALGVPPAVLVSHPPTDEAFHQVVVQAFTRAAESRLDLLRRTGSPRPAGRGKAA